MKRSLATTPNARQGSLLRKLFLVVLAATCAALLLSASALLLYEVGSYRKAWENDLTSQAELLAQSVAPTLMFDDPKAAGEALSALKLRKQIETAAVYRADGARFASYAAPGIAEQAPAALPPGVSTRIRFHDEELELFQAIEQDHELLGWVYLKARHDLMSRAIDYLWILALSCAAGLGLAALIFRQLHPAITRPILAVADTARRVMQQRDYDVRVTESSDDEVGELVQAFNNMLGDLSAEMASRRRAQEALLDADRRKDEFLATLAHELRNPLAPLTSAVAILKRVRDNPKVQASTLAVMERQLAQMVRLIDDLLEVSRITQGKLQLRRAVVDLSAIAAGALEASEPMLQQRQHAVSAQLASPPLWVDADPARLTQVFVNLLHNAAKYTDPGGHISLSASARGDTQVAVEVRDDGMGIAPEQQQQIFEMFMQVDKSLERGAAGLGVGLTIARQIVAMHGGTLEVQSEGRGRGSLFTVLLPAVAAPEPAASEGGPEIVALRNNSTRRRILLADDNVDFADGFAELLQLEGHEVHIAHDGAQALEAARRQHFDAAFLDIGMPVINGYALAQQLRQDARTRRMLLVAVTGWGQELDRQLVRQAGFDHHLVKPIDFTAAFALLKDIDTAQ